MYKLTGVNTTLLGKSDLVFRVSSGGCMRVSTGRCI